MPTQKSFRQERIDSLRDWAARISIPGLDQDTYISILGHVLEQQAKAGFWNMDAEKWQLVMTGVVLKALAMLHFKPTDRWLRSDETFGGVEPATSYLAEAVQKVPGGPCSPGCGALGEDIWDACQGLLAMAEYLPKSREAIDLARTINDNWERIYRDERDNKNRAEWCGPAYLAAIVDVLAEYESDLGPNSGYAAALDALKKFEAQDAQRQPAGYFAAEKPSDEMRLWNTGLVLRTLVAAPERYMDRAQVARVVDWLLAPPQVALHRNTGSRGPMYLARSLHALLDCRPWVDTPTRERIDQTLSMGNRELADYFNRIGGPAGNLKSYTAVLEYIAAWKIPAPAGLLFEAKRTLEASAVFRAEPVPRKDGLRIAWLSDLHLAGEHEAAPARFSTTQRLVGRINPLQRKAESFMRFKGTPITQNFAKQNLIRILEEVERIRPDHILVTGDITNYARESQFNEAHNLFLNVQRSVTDSLRDRLDPTFWTILPGNHDVTNENQMRGITKKNLGMFFRIFGSTFDSVRPGFTYETAFPIVKHLSKRGRNLIRLIGLDSNVHHPVWVVGMNTRGKLDDDQMTRLYGVLGAPAQAPMTLLALHHHPIVVPELATELEDYFLALKDTHGQRLIKTCANNSVSAILHGHFHAYSAWSALTATQQQLAIIGSAAGTITVPDTQTEEFLELCEAQRETPLGVEEGLALYKHRLGDGGWSAGYLGVFLPVPTRPDR
jgi:3',5'-cyclic AMP phosphodiesterase CpdA